MLDFLNQGWVSLLFGTIVSVVTYYAARRRAAPKAIMETYHELTWADSHKLPPGFELKYQGQTIPCISRGLLRFWNGGNETLSGDLIPKQAPLCLTIQDGKFLACGIPKNSNSVNKFEATIDSKDPKTLLLTFDFLDPSEGAVVAFLHTSNVSNPTLEGTIKGHPINTFSNPFTENLSPIVKRLRKEIIRYFPASMVLSGALIVALVMLPENLRLLIKEKYNPANEASISDSSNKYLAKTVIAIGGASYIAIGGSMFWIRRRKYPISLQWPVATIEKLKIKSSKDS